MCDTCGCDPWEWDSDEAEDLAQQRQQKARARAWSGAHFVNVYLEDRAYGGPEEGGWWFDCGEFLKSRPCRTRAEAERIMDRWNRYLDNTLNMQRRSDTSSVLSEGRFRACIQREPGRDYPDRAPHYE